MDRIYAELLPATNSLRSTLKPTKQLLLKIKGGVGMTQEVQWYTRDRVVIEVEIGGSTEKDLVDHSRTLIQVKDNQEKAALCLITARKAFWGI